MNNKEYLTVKEFSEAANISQQAVYKQLSGRLKEYTKKIKGKNLIAAAALNEYYRSEDSTTVEKVDQPDSTPSDQKIQPTVEEVKQPESTQENIYESKLKSLEDKIEELLKSKQDEIDFLRQQLTQKDKTIESLTESLRIEQQLSIADKKRVLELEDKLNQQDQQVEEVVEPEDYKEAAAVPDPTEKEQPVKKSFWKKIFG